YGCRHLSFYYRRCAESFHLQHALWIPSVNERGFQDNSCRRDGTITVNIKEIIEEIKNLLKNEIAYRNGYLQRALNIFNDRTLSDHPLHEYQHILA
ncbi:unnamed protein product, partial [Adineta ricciae]